MSTCEDIKNLSPKQCEDQHGKIVGFGLSEVNTLDTIANLKLLTNMIALINADRSTRLFITPKDISDMIVEVTDPQRERSAYGIPYESSKGYMQFSPMWNNYPIEFVHEAKSWNGKGMYAIAFTDKGKILVKSLNGLDAIGAPVTVFVNETKYKTGENAQTWGLSIWFKEEGQVFNKVITPSDYESDEINGIVDLIATTTSGSETLTGLTTGFTIELYNKLGMVENTSVATSGDIIVRSPLGVVETYTMTKSGYRYTFTPTSTFSVGACTIEMLQPTAQTAGYELAKTTITIS
jgi:hypothetical protein